MKIALHSCVALWKYHYMCCHWAMYLFEDTVHFSV